MDLGGDFNEIISAGDKFGGRPINLNRSQYFLDSINYCQFADLGYKGNRYTWTSNRRLGNHIRERLDKLMANYEWINLFPNSLVTHLPRTHSDHCPLLLQLNCRTYS